ncbi:hypothetical protein GGD83_002745 [Rhodoblastus sphagnicola]|nr:hypothetical protein [Rhodoblastus sphagnicola]MBB4198934.1 hypothetical protein [Rhodoblastus sphagnicola]
MTDQTGVLIELREGLTMGRGILLWLMGVPIPVIILIGFLYR